MSLLGDLLLWLQEMKCCLCAGDAVHCAAHLEYSAADLTSGGAYNVKELE